MRVDTFFLKYFRQAYGITGNGMQGGGSEVRDELICRLLLPAAAGTVSAPRRSAPYWKPNPPVNMP